MDEPGGAPASQSSAPHVPEGEPRTRGFLFCDLRGYTDFVERHGDRAAADLLERYRAIVRAAVARTAGAEIRTEGDGFYVVFPSASPAVRCGLEIVAAAEATTAETPDRPIRVGIGIHAGESVEGAEGYVGSVVNLAARVCAAAEPGEVLVTDTVRGLVRTSLDVAFTPRGRPRLKGIAEPIALYRVTSGSRPIARARQPRAAVPGLLAVAALVVGAGGLLLAKPWAGGGAVPSPSGGASASASSALATDSLDASAAASGDAVLPGRLAFFGSQVVGADPEPRQQLYVVAAAGGSWKRMTELTDNVDIASWSADGSALVYTVSGQENLPPRVVEVATAPTATAHPWPFATDVVEWQGRTYYLISIDWSPTGELFACAYPADDSARVRIFAVPSDGSSVRLVTEPDPESASGSNDDYWPSVSPDGLTVAFATGRSTFAIWAAAADGTGQRLQITEGIDVRPAPESVAWSPDGSRLAFAGQQEAGGPIEIWTIDAQGTDLSRLTHDDVTDQWPAFSPDGRWIAWTRTVATGQRQIWVMGADGGDPHPLIVGAEGEQLDLVGWAPDPR